MLKFIFNILTAPLGFPIEWYWEYLILAVISAIAYLIAYQRVGDMYREGTIVSSAGGSFFHWLIRLFWFVILWAAIRGIINAVKWLTDNWLLILSVLIGIVAIAGIATVILTVRIKRKCKKVVEVTTDESH